MIRAAVTFALAGAATLFAAGHLAREWSPAEENPESPAVRTVEIDWWAEAESAPPVKPPPPDASAPVRTELHPASEASRPAAPVDPVPPEARAVAAPAPPQPEPNDSTELVRRMLHLYRRHVEGE